MKVYDMIVAERLRMADMLAGFTVEQWATRTLCTEWTVHECAAHLLTYLRLGQLKLTIGIIATAADFDRINVELTRRQARRPSQEIVSYLRRHARSKVTIPRSGYDPVLADLVLHDLDIRRPLGIPRDIPEDRLLVAFHHLTAKPSPGFTMGDRLAGLRVVATDTGWTAGSGALVEGPAESLVLGISGRPAGLDELRGDGVPTLRKRLTPTPPPPPLRRLLAPLMVLLSPQPKERRSRNAVEPA
jgi:uncharacterized protein (TIGR03083 family)